MKPHKPLPLNLCRKYILIIWLAVCSAGIVFLALINLVVLPECVIYNLTGLFCGGCGTTRMLDALLRGDIALAFRQNMATFILIPFLIIYSIFCFVGWPEFFRHKTVIYIVVFGTLIAWLLFGILRNFPCFSYLAPIG